MIDDRCPLCGGDFIDELVVFTADLKPGILVLKDVPARVCFQCGYESIPYKTALQIEELAQAARSKSIDVEVAKYSVA